MTQISQTLIQLPTLNQDRLIRVVLTHPKYRKQGPQVQHQLIKDRHIFHNYGFGAASLNMAYGSAYIIGKSFKIFIDPSINPTCAVIGSGISGLMTAIELTKYGKLVTIYSQVIPQLNQNDSSKLLPSQSLPQVWMPNEYDWSQDELKHELMSKMSYDFFRQSNSLNRYQSIKKVTVYDRQNTVEDLHEVVSDYVFDTFKPTNIRYSSGHLEAATQYETLYINSRLLVQELRVQAVLRGVKFVQRKFHSFQEISSLKEEAIFNCTGSASSYLFGDKNFKDQSTLVLQFEQPANHKREYVLKGPRKNQAQNFDIFCVGKTTFLIIPSNGKTSIDKNQLQDKLSKINKFIQTRNNTAKL